MGASSRSSVRFRALTLAALASLTSPAFSADPPAPVIWYRASQECPAGPEFLGGLSGRASGSRLAQAGDHPDFVVTLVVSEGGTLGRLERQTQSGTVAIRELRDSSCPKVADALAFSLALALEPEQPAPASESPAAAPSDEAQVPASDEDAVNAEKPAVAAPSSPRPSEARVTPIEVATARERDTGESPPHSASASVSPLWAGLEGGVMTGIAPEPLARAAVFMDVEDVLATHWAFRFAAVGVLGSTSTEIGSLRQWLLAGRLEACPWRWRGSGLSLRPCVAFELGAMGAESTRSGGNQDTGLWAAPGGVLRGGVALSSRLRLEAEAGAVFPLLRNDVYAGSSALYRAPIAAFQGAAAVSFGLP